jgi:CheY-like chemotaxis protein
MAPRVVLVLQDEPSERALTTQHLRESGFDVIEVADGDEARRVLDAEQVDIVLADYDMPRASDGSDLLRKIRERRLANRTILTSIAEPNIGAVEGYGVFLSKPYRMVDLDHCLQRILIAANKPAREETAAIRSDQPQGDSRSNEARLGRVPEKKRPFFSKAARGVDDVPDEWSAELARQLAERAARQEAVDPRTAKAGRRAALRAYDRARARRLRLILGFALGAATVAAVAGLGPMVGLWPDPFSVVRTEAVSSVDTAGIKLASIVPDPRTSSSVPTSRSSTPGMPDSPVANPAANPTPSTTVAQSASAPALHQPTASSPPQQPESIGPGQPPSPIKKIEPPSAGQATPVEQATNQSPLAREEVREIQTRLRWFGFNPGPIDGATGARTTAAIIRYQQARGESQTGTVDRDLLAQLREDPAPQSAQPTTGVDAAARPYPRRRSDPFEPMRREAERFDRWMQSLLR